MVIWNRKKISEKLDNFKKFLSTRGAEVLEPKSEWELIRFLTDKGISVIYTKKNGALTFYGSAEDAWIAFLNPSISWRARPATKRTKENGTITTLRKRDGDGCFYCLLPVSQEEASVEHLLSLTHGGSNHITNKVLTHTVCNSKADCLCLMDKIKIHVRAHMQRCIHGRKKSNE